MSDATRPTLSVVIAASQSRRAVAEALATLPPDLDRVVAAPGGWAPVRLGETWVSGEPAAGVPRLRRLGLDAARGDVVVLTEDSCRFSPGWVDAWRLAFADPAILAAGGPVVPAMGDTPIDRAVFLVEYAAFAGAVHPGRLPGNNVALRRSLADRLDPDAIEESQVQAVAGPATAWAAGAAAWHVRRYGVAEALRDRLRFGYGFGRARWAGRPAVLRWAGLIGGPPILAAQSARLLVQARRRGLTPERLAEDLPLTAALLTAWSVGEWLGWVRSALDRPSGPPSPAGRGREARPGAPATGPAGS